MTPADFRKARTTLGLTQHAMAEALRMGKRGWQTISAWENGKQAIPGPVELAVECLLERAALAAENAALTEKVERLEGALKIADDAISEMFRYYDGGEMRGSYDGKPERNQLRKAGYVTRAALKGDEQ